MQQHRISIFRRTGVRGGLGGGGGDGGGAGGGVCVSRGDGAIT